MAHESVPRSAPRNIPITYCICTYNVQRTKQMLVVPNYKPIFFIYRGEKLRTTLNIWNFEWNT